MADFTHISKTREVLSNGRPDAGDEDALVVNADRERALKALSRLIRALQVLGIYDKHAERLSDLIKQIQS